MGLTLDNGDLKTTTKVSILLKNLKYPRFYLNLYIADVPSLCCSIIFEFGTMGWLL
jgi:hypothetical protein